MRFPAALLGIAVLAGCSAFSPPKPAGDPDLPPVPIPPAETQSVVQQVPTDARIAEMQTQMTELLERLDVLNARIAKLEQGPVPIAPAPATHPAAAAPAPQPVASAPAIASSIRAADLADAYRNALMLYGKGRQTEARAAFQHIFDADPNGDLADNALYWIGETYFASGDYSNAMRYYSRVTKDYADQNKAPDSMFKLALSYVRTGDLAMAKRTFEEVIRKYPYSTPAAAAKFELKRIKY